MQCTGEPLPCIALSPSGSAGRLSAGRRSAGAVACRPSSTPTCADKDGAPGRFARITRHTTMRSTGTGPEGRTGSRGECANGAQPQKTQSRSDRNDLLRHPWEAQRESGSERAGAAGVPVGARACCGSGPRSCSHSKPMRTFLPAPRFTRFTFESGRAVLCRTFPPAIRSFRRTAGRRDGSGGPPCPESFPRIRGAGLSGHDRQGAFPSSGSPG